jgi:hypothetical protein
VTVACLAVYAELGLADMYNHADAKHVLAHHPFGGVRLDRVFDSVGNYVN